MTDKALKLIAKDVQRCCLCEEHLPHGPRPVFQISRSAKIMIAGQAPGIRVHRSGVPFDDPSGDRLRQWMGIDKDTFYNANKIAILPMGFCYPGTGKSGDLPPRPECADTWRDQLLASMPNIELTLVIGVYAQKWHLGSKLKKNLTETVRNWETYWPENLPLPHPSPRNNIWLSKNAWFEADVIPSLQKKIAELVA